MSKLPYGTPQKKKVKIATSRGYKLREANRILLGAISELSEMWGCRPPEKNRQIVEDIKTAQEKIWAYLQGK